MSSRNKTATTVHERGEQTPRTRLSGPPGESRSNRRVMTPKDNVMRTARIVDTSVATTAVDEELSTGRLNVMRFGYAFMGSDWPSSNGPFSSKTPHPSP